jgi:Putative Ig domain
MKQIHITRDSNDKVTFEEVSIDATENVFFTNLDPQQAHWPYLDPKATSPDFCDNQIGPAPSPNSSQCTVPVPSGKNPPYAVTYKCKLHENEQGTINVFAQLAAGTTALPQASLNTPLPAPVQVVVGGKSPYTVTGQLFQVTDNGGVIQSGSGSIGPGLQLNPDQQNNGGITITGTPTVAGTYKFTFTVNDGMGKNLQQVQYSMKVA